MSGKPKEVSRKEVVQTECARLNERQRKAVDRVHAIRRRMTEVDSEVSEAAMRGDEEALSTLEAESVSLPSALKVAETAERSIAAALAERSAELNVIVRAEQMERLLGLRGELAKRDEGNAADLAEAVKVLGRALAERERLVSECADLCRALSGYGASVEGVKPAHEVLAGNLLALQSVRGYSESRQLTIPLLTA